jgi:meso-butanediol dehydrogenase/(S,S)-butanediol dehydrogenase/diacetyl reductase
MSGKLERRVAVVIGASGGIGQALVSRMCAEGAIVIATSSRVPIPSEAARGPRSSFISQYCDLNDPSSLEALVAFCQETHGRVDILVNNAGISIGSQRIHETSPEKWQSLMDINVRGVFLGMRAFLPMMISARTGCILNMASTAAMRGTPGAGAYCASKAAVLQLTKVAALEYVKDGIRVNCLCPGTVDTQLLNQVSEERRRELLARIPMGRFATPEDVAALAAFLASDDAAYITGQGYIIDGGRLSA